MKKTYKTALVGGRVQSRGQLNLVLKDKNVKSESV